MSNLTFDKNQAISILQETTSNEFAVDFDLVWQWLDYSRKDNAKTKFMKCGFVENQDYTILNIKDRVEGNNGGGSVKTEKLYLTVDCVKAFCMLS